MKILIIGAGIAGITAGKILRDRNIDFEILEASAVYGGRIKKIDNFADFPIDLGAEWIHKWILARPKPLKSILSNNDSKFKTFIEKPKTFFTWKNNKLRKRKWFNLWNDSVSAVNESIKYESVINELMLGLLNTKKSAGKINIALAASTNR